MLKLTPFRSTEVLSRDKESGSFAGRHISPLLLAQYFGESYGERMSGLVMA